MSVMTTALRDSLKTLRLSGMLETLDARLTQAQGGELGHLDFLQVLCQDEISRRETVALERRLRKAKFEQQATLKASTSTLPRSCRPPRSATWRPCAGSTPASPSFCSDPSASGRHTLPRPSAIRLSAKAPTSASPRPAASWPSSPGATRTAPGTSACARSSTPTCSSSTTSPCAS